MKTPHTERNAVQGPGPDGTLLTETTRFGVGGWKRGDPGWSSIEHGEKRCPMPKSLRARLIRVAYTHPEFKEALLPLVRQAAGERSKVIKSFIDFLKRAKKKEKNLSSGGAGPWATTDIDRKMITVDLRPWIDSLEDEDAAFDVIMSLFNRNNGFDQDVAEAIGFGDVPYVSHRGPRHRHSPADYEILDDEFSAISDVTIYIN